MPDAPDHAAAPSSAVADVLARPELVHAITAHVGAGDALAWALACKGFRAAQVRVRAERASPAAARSEIISPAREFLSPSRAAWVMTGGMHGGHMVPTSSDQHAFCRLAAEAGELKGLQALRSRGCEWAEYAMCSAAARGGHLEVLQWLREHGCILDEETC